MVFPPPRSTSSQPAASSSCCCLSFSLRGSRLSLTRFSFPRRRGSYRLPLAVGCPAGRGLWRRVSLDKEPGVVPGPVGARGSEGLLVGEQDQEVDELALGDVRVQERAEPLSQVVGVPQRPLGVGTIRLYVRLMVSLTDLAKELLQPLGKIQFGHVALLEVFLRATRHYSRDTRVPQRRTCPASSALIDSLCRRNEKRCPSPRTTRRICGVSTTSSRC